MIKTKLMLLALTFVSLMFGDQNYERPSSYPYISGDTFRAFCDHIFDETNQKLEPSSIKNGDTIFIKTDCLNQFVAQIQPHITASYIIVTHNSAQPVPGDFKRLLNDSHIVAWFGQNVELQHEKLTPIPLGIANARWPHGNIQDFKTLKHKPLSKRTKFLYINFSTHTNIEKRHPIMKLFRTMPFCHITPQKPFYDYLKDLSNAVFVVSPEGRGIDCHRTWEALYAGAIPIVKTSSIDALFADLPVLIIDDWNMLSKEFLEKNYSACSNKSFLQEKLFAPYWFERIKIIQNIYKKQGDV